MSYTDSSSTQASCMLDGSYESAEYGSEIFSDVTDASTGVNMLPKQSPTVQVMERPSADQDPNRISTAIFAGRSSAMDWSAASSESLFSIHAGTSFQRDLGSKELYKSDELVRMKQASPATKEVDYKKNIHKAKISLDDMKPGGTGRGTAEPISDFTHAFRNNKIATSIGQSRDPDQCKFSSQPFPLPKKKKSSCLCLLCHCHGCCTWPSCCKGPCCSCKCRQCPNCSLKCFTRPSCFRNCCKWPSCSCKCPTCSSCSCKCLTSSSCPSCSVKCPTCPSCSSCCCKCSNCPSCSFKCPTCPSCSSCCCKCSNCPSCSFKCPTCPSCSSCCCKCPTCPSCSFCSSKCLTCPSGCFKCPSWLSCSC